MIEFLKKLLESKDEELTFVLFNDDEPESSTTYQFRPLKLFNIIYITIGATAVLILLVVMFTPLGSYLYNQEDEELRQSAIEIQQRVESLTDSLEARDDQLTEMRNILASGQDTTFDVSAPPGGENTSQSTSGSELQAVSPVETSNLISSDEIIFSNLFKSEAEFPAMYPVDGIVSRDYNAETGHYGIDIAAEQNVPFRAIAAGSVISQEWTVNYGYVIYVHHNNGLVSVYKHASSVTKSIGDIVLKGDNLGTVGDVGILSSGPHLHVEIWKNGAPQNPNTYLVKS